jgi:ribosomal protein S18 acetylase RimI-like enzyme
MNKLQQRKAKLTDLPDIIAMLADDELGKTRENNSTNLDKRYLDAFHRINADPNQYLMVVVLDNNIVGTSHLTFMPSLTKMGTTRMQIEAVRVASTHRGQHIGEWMIEAALELARENNALFIQLTTDKKRTHAKRFYERLGFKATHEGMKYIHAAATNNQ